MGWIGPEDPGNPDTPRLGELGTVISIDPPDEWVVSCGAVRAGALPALAFAGHEG